MKTMLKIVSAVTFILSAWDGSLSIRWFNQAKKSDWDCKRVFYGVVCLLNAAMHVLMACELWQISEEEALDAADADWDDFDDFED